MAKGIIGGAESQPSTVYRHGFFHAEAGVDAFMPSANKNTVKQMRILPSFDYNKEEDARDFKSSYVPFRVKGVDTSWYFYVIGYVFFGEINRHFISPLVLESKENRMRVRGKDPIRDCYSLAKAMNRADLTEREKLQSAIIPAIRDFVMANVYVMDNENEVNNKVMIFTNSAMKDLESQLQTRPGRNDPEINPNFPDLLYGDITDPKTGLALTVVEKSMPLNTTIKFTGFRLATRPQTLDGKIEWPIDPATPDGLSVLESRYNLSDIDNVTYIPSYQEMLEYIVEFSDIPEDIYSEACGPYVDRLPSKNKNRKVFTPSDAPEQSSGGGSFGKAKPKSAAAPVSNTIRYDNTAASEFDAGDDEEEVVEDYVESGSGDWNEDLQKELDDLTAKLGDPSTSLADKGTMTLRFCELMELQKQAN